MDSLEIGKNGKFCGSGIQADGGAKRESRLAGLVSELGKNVYNKYLNFKRTLKTKYYYG